MFGSLCFDRCVLVSLVRSLAFWFLKSPQALWSWVCFFFFVFTPRVRLVTHQGERSPWPLRHSVNKMRCDRQLRMLCSLGVLAGVLTKECFLGLSITPWEPLRDERQNESKSMMGHRPHLDLAEMALCVCLDGSIWQVNCLALVPPPKCGG